jgi:hypothetical protein
MLARREPILGAKGRFRFAAHLAGKAFFALDVTPVRAAHETNQTGFTGLTRFPWEPQIGVIFLINPSRIQSSAMLQG